MLLNSISKNAFINKITESGSVGIYFRYKDDFGTLFKSLNCSQENKELLFLYYFEMYVVDELLRILSDIETYDSQHADEWGVLKSKISRILSCDRKDQILLDELSIVVNEKINAVDMWVRKSRYLESAEEKLLHLIDGTNIVRNICEAVSNSISALKDTKFLIIVDEYENASDYQHILNTLLKQVDHTSNISYRVGTRPKGIKTLHTNVGTEFLQIDRDFLLYVLQSQAMPKYKAFVRAIANKRLEGIEFFKKNGLTDIVKLLGSMGNLDEEANIVVKGKTKHFEVLKDIIAEKDYQQTIDLIKKPDSPLMEMLNILWVLRGVPAQKVNHAMNFYIDGYHKYHRLSDEGELAYKYKLDYSDKYRYHLLFTLLGIYGQNKKYYSFNTFAYLSSGAVNDFISLCRNTFYLIDESYYERVSSNSTIPISIQAVGAENTAIEQMDKIKLCSENGTEMYMFAMNIGNYLKYLHRDIYAKYPETNQFAFDNEREIEDRVILADVRNSLIKWGIIIKKPRIQSISIGKRKGTLYYLNRIFSPIFSISFRTRGGYNFVMPTALFELLLKESLEPSKIAAWKKTDYITPTKKIAVEKPDASQLSLFEVINDE